MINGANKSLLLIVGHQWFSKDFWWLSCCFLLSFRAYGTSNAIQLNMEGIKVWDIL